MSQPALSQEDYRILEFSYGRGGGVMPAELSHKWRRYHDVPGAARAELDHLVASGAGQWRPTPKHPSGEFVLTKPWMEYFAKKKSDALDHNLNLIWIALAGGAAAIIIGMLRSVG